MSRKTNRQLVTYVRPGWVIAEPFAQLEGEVTVVLYKVLAVEKTGPLEVELKLAYDYGRTNGEDLSGTLHLTKHAFDFVTAISTRAKKDS